MTPTREQAIVSRRNATRLRRRLFEVVPADVLERPIAKPLPALKPIPGATIRRVAPANSDDWRDLLPRRRWRSVERFKARGDYGYVAIIDGDFAGEIWVSRISHRDPWSGFRLRLAPDEAYTYAMEVEVPFRPLGVAAAIVAAVLQGLRDEGSVERVYGWVDARNRRSQVLLRMVFGFTQTQSVKRAHLLGIGFQVPRSDRPPFGPVSRQGHHSNPTQ